MHADRIKALRWERPARIPTKVGILPAAWIKHREALDEVLSRHPDIYADHQRAGRDYDEVTEATWVEGEHVDEWGCTWSNVKRGMAALVTRFPVTSRDAVRTMRVPDVDVGLPHGFMYLRLVYLRGFEELMCDFAEEPPELQLLIDKVLAYNLRQARLRLAAAAAPAGRDSIVGFGDDLGMQDRLPISPRLWRRYLKPCFAQLAGVFGDAGHYVYMHSDGHVLEIIPDLVDCGIDVLNLQVGSNGLDNLARAVAENRVCIDLDLDRQMFPYWTPAEIDAHIRDAAATIGTEEGGLWLSAEIGEDVPLPNVEAILSALDRYSRIYS